MTADPSATISFGDREVEMYVVKIAYLDEPTEYKAFTALPDALKLFREADNRVVLDGVRSANLFEVSGETNARRAVDAVKAGRAAVLKQDTIGTLKL